MITLKIECACGQRFAFDVEPVDGRMPAAVFCPGCGADGTAIANAALTPNQPPPPATPPPPAKPGGLRFASQSKPPAPEPESPTVPANFLKAGGPTVGKVDRDQAEREAKAKIFWATRRSR